MAGFAPAVFACARFGWLVAISAVSLKPEIGHKGGAVSAGLLRGR